MFKSCREITLGYNAEDEDDEVGEEDQGSNLKFVG